MAGEREMQECLESVVLLAPRNQRTHATLDHHAEGVRLVENTASPEEVR